MSRALYRKYRSKNLSEIVGQEHITGILKRAIDSDNIGHAYLLTGPRGTGKTSVARILAHEINKLPYKDESDHLDIIEIDAASNNGVDDVRDLRDKALIAPASARKKVYIIDEVHMLSKQAFNALLKILEEPPAHVVFILATTDFDKVPDTIISRTQRFNFHLIEPEKVSKHLEYIAKKEDIKISKDAINLIAERGGGSFRDSISLLDQLRNLSDKEITSDLIEKTLGLATKDDIESLLNAIDLLDSKKIIEHLKDIEAKGVSASTLSSQILNYMRNNIVHNPTYIHYLDSLTNVAKSPHPDIALLISLLELSSKADSLIRTKSDNNNQPTMTEISKPAKLKTVSTSIGKTISKVSSEAKISESKATNSKKHLADEVDVEKKETKNKKIDNSTIDFDWQKILDSAEANKTKYIGIYSLLNKCTPLYENGALTLYAGNKFCKNRLDDTKNRILLSQIIEKTHNTALEIITLAQPAPPKDEQAAKVAAIMGGGEEVNV